MQRRSSRQFQRGFTLAEVMVATAIFAVIMIAALAVYDQSNRVFVAGSQSSDLQQSTRIGFDRLVADIRMAGFDYNRGGTPQDPTQYPQPDEQIEYAGVNVLAFRANFNYNTATTGCSSSAFGDQTAQPCDNGVEPEITPLVNGKPVFPYVTTNNSEIIVYALRSANASKNTSEISFWADVHMPYRAAYPNSPTSGKEQLVTLGPTTCGTCGIDTSGSNPPYTLYRITVADILAGAMGTPVAENIRTLRFFYYTDTNGNNVLKDPKSTSNPPADISETRNASTSDDVANSALVTINGVSTPTGAIGGAGQYVINSAGTVVPDATDPLDRQARSTITSIRADVIGMNAAPDGAYTNPSEPVAALQHYREYTLSALITPRNLGLTGFPEQNYAAPVPPTITGVCTGVCAAPTICWTPQSGGGPVVEYIIGMDTSPIGAFSTQFIVANPAATSAAMPDIYGIDPSKTWYYKVNAVNNNGSSPWADLTPVAAQPINTTRPQPPTQLQAVTPPQQYAVTLNWTAATNHDPANDTVTCTGTCTSDGSLITSAEDITFKIYRGKSITFDPSKNQGVVVLSNTTSQPIVNPGSSGQFVDAVGSSAYPAAACTPYFYRIQEMNRCATNANWNNPKQTSQATSDYSPAVSPIQNALGPVQATDAGPNVMASAPTALTVRSSVSACPAASTPGICSIALTWPQVTTDTAKNAIAVDRYQITRMWKGGSGQTTSFQLDSTFGTGGYYNLSGQSDNNTGAVNWTDNTAPAYDTCGDASCAFIYEYIVQANDCRVSWPCPGGANDTSCLPTAIFPANCTGVNPVTIQSDATNGSGSKTNPWEFAGSDTVTVTDTNSTIHFQSVQVTANGISSYPPITSCGGFDCAVWTQTGLSPGGTYQIDIITTYTNGCVEGHTRWATDVAAASCFLSASGNPPFTTEQTFKCTSPTSNCKQSGGSTKIYTITETYNVTNTPPAGIFATDALSFDLPDGSAGEPMSITFTVPPGFPDLTLTQIQFTLGKSTFAVTPNSKPGAGTWTLPLTAPKGMPLLPAGSSMSVAISWTFLASDNGGTPLSPPLMSKFCLGYVLSSNPNLFQPDPNDTTVKHCDVIGAAAGTNPTACN